MGKALPATHPVVAGATMLREQLDVPFPLQSVETGHATKRNPRSSSPPTYPYGSVVAATPGGYHSLRYHRRAIRARWLSVIIGLPPHHFGQ